MGGCFATTRSFEGNPLLGGEPRLSLIGQPKATHQMPQISAAIRGYR
jgi:hypothetical protein